MSLDIVHLHEFPRLFVLEPSSDITPKVSLDYSLCYSSVLVAVLPLRRILFTTLPILQYFLKHKGNLPPPTSAFSVGY